MAMEFVGLHETPEEIEAKKRQAAAQRLRVLGAVMVIVLVARVFVKNPPPPKQVDRRNERVRYTPGMLDNIPQSKLQKMDPQMLAKLRVAEQDYKMAELTKSYGTGAATYKPAEMPAEDIAEKEMLKQIQYVYEKRRAVSVRLAAAEKDNPDMRKTMLVRFRSGGYIKAEKAARTAFNCEISIDKSLTARLPNQMVSAVSSDAIGWKAPLRPGDVELRPARGISITLNRETAKRISIRKQTYDET